MFARNPKRSCAREQSSDNPVYYLQYAHARICSVARQCADKGIVVDAGNAALARLENSHEEALIKHLGQFTEHWVAELRRLRDRPSPSSTVAMDSACESLHAAWRALQSQ